MWVMAAAAAAILASTITGKREDHAPAAAIRLDFGGRRRGPGASRRLPRHACQRHVAEDAGSEAPIRSALSTRSALTATPGRSTTTSIGAVISSGRCACRSASTAARPSMGTRPSIVPWQPGIWQPDWASDPQLKSAGLVIGPVKAPLTQMLRHGPALPAGLRGQGRRRLRGAQIVFAAHGAQMTEYCRPWELPLDLSLQPAA